MGPRARRRLAAIAVGVGAIAAVAVGFELLSNQSPDSCVPSSCGHVMGKTDKLYYSNSGKLTFGMTKQQVRRLVGPPSKVFGRCWLYRINRKFPANGRRTGDVTWNADKVCFEAGQYSERHTQLNGIWDHPTS